MKKRKCFVRSAGAALAIALLQAKPAMAGIPTFDGVNLVQNVLNIIEWGQQLEQMVTSVQQQADQLQSMTGSRMLGMILNDPSLQSYLPADMGNVYSSITQSGGGLTGAAQSLRNSTKIYDCNTVPNDFKSICQSNLNKNSQDMTYSRTAFQTATTRNDQIQDLMRQINSTTDEKSIAELTARINGESAAVQNEANRIAIAQQMKAEAERANEQKAAEWMMSALDRDSAASGFVYTP